MKNLFTLITALLISIVAMGQSPVITFDKTTHDFGKINEADGRVTTIFTFKNEGMSTLTLTNVKASCGCTTPKYTQTPIEPGQTGEITVTYNPTGRPGRFQKTVTVTSNATVPSTKLYIKGEVIPKPTAPVDQYPMKMGELSLKKKAINYGSLVQGSVKTLEIEYANQTDQEITVELLMSDIYSYIKPNVTLKSVGPKQTGKLQFALETKESPLGPINAKAYVMVNGKRDISGKYEINISANVKEDFTQLTVEELQQAPIVEVVRELNLGTIAKGKKLASKITISNVGINPLYIRRIVIKDPALRVIEPKSPIKSGRKADLKLEVTTKETTNATQYSRILTLITNDPKNPVINIKLNWVVE